MKYFVLVAIIVFLLVAVQFSQAQTIDDLVIKYEAALGGKEKLNAIKSIYIEAAKTAMDVEFPIQIVIEQNKLFRSEFDFSNGTGFQVITPEEAWIYSPGKNLQPQQLNINEVAAMQIQLDIAGPLVDYVAKGHKAELLGKDMLDEKDCYKIKLTTKAGKSILYWLDAATGLMIQSRRKVLAANGVEQIDVLTTYKNYKEVDGIQFAHTIETYNSALGGDIINISKIEINKPVELKMYEPK